MVRKIQYCGSPEEEEACLVWGEELKKEISFHQCSKIMRKMAVCKDEIWGIWGKKKKRHELKKQGKEVMQKTVAEMQGTKGKYGWRVERQKWKNQAENGKLECQIHSMWREPLQVFKQEGCDQNCTWGKLISSRGIENLVANTAAWGRGQEFMGRGSSVHPDFILQFNCKHWTICPSVHIARIISRQLLLPMHLSAGFLFYELP